MLLQHFLHFFDSSWMIGIIAEYLDIFEMAKWSITCRDLYDNKTLYSMYLEKESTILDTFIFLLTRYQLFVDELRHYVLPSNDDIDDISDIGDIDKKLDFSWDVLIQFILRMMKKDSTTRVIVNGLLKLDARQLRGMSDMMTTIKSIVEFA